MKRPIHKYIPYIVKVAVDGRRGPIWDIFNLFPDGHGSPFRDRNYAGDRDTNSDSSNSSSSSSSDSSNPNSVPSGSAITNPSYIIPSIPSSGSIGGGSTFHLKVPGGPEISFGPGGPSIVGGNTGGFPGAFPAGTRVTPLVRARVTPATSTSTGRTYTEDDLRRRQEEIDRQVAEDRRSREHADSLIEGAIADRRRNARAWKWYRGLHGLGITGGGIAGYNLGKLVNSIAGLDDSNNRSWNGFLANLAIKGLGTGAGAFAGHLLTKRFLQPRDLSSEDVVYRA